MKSRRNYQKCTANQISSQPYQIRGSIKQNDKWKSL